MDTFCHLCLYSLTIGMTLGSSVLKTEPDTKSQRRSKAYLLPSSTRRNVTLGKIDVSEQGKLQ